MTIAILSDIHGNLPALEAVLDDLRGRSFDAVYCLGDLVGYGASPNEVVSRIRAEGIPTIIGNYDDGVGFDRDDCGCAYREDGERARGQRSLMWTRQQTTADHKAYLRSLVPQIRLEANGRRVLLVHGSPRRMNEYLFEDRPLSSFERLAAASDADVIVFGHTHRPYTKLVGDVLFVNAGSIGKPKDGDWRACYILLTPGAADPVEFIRVPYDVGRAAAAIRSTDLPHEFADDIERGGAPAPTHTEVEP
ncbi:MAG: YfcE family phosphodiesterase [Acidobacteria bacterium SCN 69-37]|nr:MAG: YfcE family phosphodiesterase [Acidobacteria bacterium SCN 69-37]